jgi:spermidine/putrescine transport system permease protein
VSSFLKRYALYAVAFFVIGIGFGVWSQKHNRQLLTEATPLRVLCQDNWISEAVLKKFSREHHVPIQFYTYSRPSELLRQMANSDGKIDVVCTSSMLLKSLVASHWIQKTNFDDVENIQQVSVDFRHLPFDPNGEYGVPLFWNVYGFFGKQQTQETKTWKQTWSSKRVTLWGEELNLLNLMSRIGIDVDEGLEKENTKNIESEVHQFAHKASDILPPDFAVGSAEAMMSKADWILLPLAKVARLVGENSPYRFWLPEDGGSVEVGLLTIGSKSEQPELAKELIGQLISTEHSLEVQRRLGSGVTNTALNSLGSIAPLQKPGALRQFPLNRFEFPDVNVESLPRFQKIYDDNFKEKEASRRTQ